MITSNTNSTYEEIYGQLSFPIIILDKDLSIIYMNTEAENTYGKYFKNPIWKRKYFQEGVIDEIIAHLEKGESVTVTPPHINEFTKMLFQPIPEQNGNGYTVRLNLDVFRSGPHSFESHEAYNTMYDRSKGAINTAQMASEALIDRAGRPDSEKYAKIIHDNIDALNSNLMNSEYLFNLINRHNLNHETMFNPINLLPQILSKRDGVLSSQTDEDESQALFDATAFEYAIDTILNHLKALSNESEVKIEAEEKESHFVFIFKTKRALDIKADSTTLKQNQIKMEALKVQTEKLEGNLIQINSGSSIKVLYSIRKHLRSEYSMTFRQDFTF